MPHSTLQAWWASPDRLDACPEGVAFVHSLSGLAFLHRRGIAWPGVCGELGVCGLRLGGLRLALTGLNRGVGASYGPQQQVNRGVAEAIVASRRPESARLAHAMPPKDMTGTQDETFTGGLCLGGMEPVSNSIVLEHAAQARDYATWQAHMEQALAGLTCRVMQSTRDAAPGLLAYVAHHRGAHLSPDLFHGQPELSKAVYTPMAGKPRAAAQAVARTAERLHQGHAYCSTPDKRAPGRPPKAAACLAQGGAGRGNRAPNLPAHQ